ncbi:MAG: hypothetical protein CYPHOPRED_005481 [Cyphobasidiales sp. Tagirdzhanova-0007]|nr:MAG: hypothetical protein CYPHOPRED_005481 [Cyphobasidiales sp. Tagirdzhanova-0007]
MGMIRGLLTGFTLAGIITVAYEQRLYSTSSYLRAALTSLSKELDALRIQSSPDVIPSQPMRLEQLPLGEQVKVQWNEQLLRGIHGLYSTEWARLADTAWRVSKAEALEMKDRLSS